MADGKELKPKSFRIDDETAEKFKEISNTIGGNQQETLAKLIEAFEFQSGKAILTEKKADIEQFEKYITAITRMYMGSLEDNQNITETVRTEFDALLKSKDTTIQDLQEKLTVAKQLKEDATLKARTHADENARLNSVIDSLNNEYNSKMDDMQSMLSDKDSLNKALTDSCNNLKAKIEGMKEAAEQSAILRKELDQLKQEHEKVIREQSDLEKQMQQEQTAHEKTVSELKQHEADALERLKEQLQLAQDKAILQIEKSYQEQMQKLKADKQAEVDKYQQKYFDLLEQMKTKTAAVEQN
jgi:chromosome segregation ATPase